MSKLECFDSSNYVLGGKPIVCRVEGCKGRAGVFGFCKNHVDEHVDEKYVDLVVEGKASAHHPACFEDARQYREYAVLWAAASDNKTQHCRDCSPEFREQQTAAGTCGNPETVFVRDVRQNGGLSGIPLDASNPYRWEQALLGVYGEIVDRPAQPIMDAAFGRIAFLASVRRRRGRPLKGGL